MSIEVKAEVKTTDPMVTLTMPLSVAETLRSLTASVAGSGKYWQHVDAIHGALRDVGVLYLSRRFSPTEAQPEQE